MHLFSKGDVQASYTWKIGKVASGLKKNTTVTKKFFSWVPCKTILSSTAGTFPARQVNIDKGSGEPRSSVADEARREGSAQWQECCCGWFRWSNKEVSGDEVAQAGTRDALRLDEQTMGLVGWKDEGEGGTKEEVHVFGLGATKKYFHVWTQSHRSKP